MTANRRQVLVGATMLAAEALALPSHAGSPSPSLLVVGDWGRDGASHQRDVARQMDAVAREFDCKGVLSVGDNFYEDGVRSVDDPKWRSSYEDVYTGDHLGPLPWYVALGNHDYGGVPQAQVEYTGVSRRWNMPARYFKVAGGDIAMPGLDIFIVDTSPLIAEDAIGDDPLNVNVRTQDTGAQLAWLDRELAASTAKYRIVAGHHTIFSGGDTHGDTPDLVARLLPVLKRHGVTAYINGHDHDLQHIVRDGMSFVCSGAGSEVRPVYAIPGTRFCVSRSGFSILSLGDDGLWLEFRDYTGASLYRSALA